MQKSKATKYALLAIAILLIIIAVPLLSMAIGWLLIGISLCALVAFGVVSLLPKFSSSQTAEHVTERPRELHKAAQTQAFKAPPSIVAPPSVAPPPPVIKPPITRKSGSPSKPNLEKTAPTSRPSAPITKPIIKRDGPKRPSPKSRKKYERLFRPYQNQSERGAFAHFYYHGIGGETQETPFKRLADMAKHEDWNYSRSEFQKPNETLPILWNYLNHTFLRLQTQRKIEITQDKQFSCFNTGLQTSSEKDIFALFKRNTKADKSGKYPDWWFESWCDRTSPEIEKFDTVPAAATYIETGDELFFKSDYDIRLNLKHIVNDVKNHERLPRQLQNEPMLAKNAIEGATKASVEKCKNNYRLAIPSWYERGKKVQLLLPLYLTDPPEEADLALVADRDDRKKEYFIKTAFTLDMAYRHARVINQPNREWLNP